MINDCKTEDDISKLFQSRFSSLFSFKLLEQILSMESLPANPLKSFPIDINTNIYADIVHFALDHAQDVIQNRKTQWKINFNNWKTAQLTLNHL